MSLLKKFGVVLQKITSILTGFGPVIAATEPKAAPTVDRLEQIVNTIFNVEGMAEGINAAGGQVTPAQKVAAAAPFVAQIVQTVAHVAGKEPKNKVLYDSAVKGLTSSIADLLNSYE